MKFKGSAICLLAFAVAAFAVAEANAQCNDCCSQGFSGFRSVGGHVYNGPDAEGMSTTYYRGRINPARTAKLAAQNRFSPQRVYTYSNPGIDAQRTHMWNQEEAQCRSWHDNYKYWRWDTPTALVVPPTASYEASYGWGVGQVRNTPIHSQFGRQGAGMIGGGSGGYSATPYWPSNTRQFGVYPVRAPW